MRYLSMFSGIGGFELGIQQAYELLDSQPKDEGVHTSEDSSCLSRKPSQRTPHCIGYSEIDKYAIQVYEKRFPHSYNYGDATKINARKLNDFEILVGGFPCQAFSVAGKRRGFGDTRGTLFFEIARILKAKRPRHLVLENVQGLLSHDKGKTFQTILGVLSDLGYRVEWQVLNSKHFGVPQTRDRVFIIGHLRGGCSRQVFPLQGGNGKDLKEVTTNVSDSQRIYRIDGVASTITGRGGGQGAKTGLYAVPLKYLNRNQRNYQGEYSFTVDTVNSGGILRDNRVRRLTPTECERLQGFPDGWTEGLSDTQRYKTLGNAVTVNVIQSIFTKLWEK